MRDERLPEDLLEASLHGGRRVRLTLSADALLADLSAAAAKSGQPLSDRARLSIEAELLLVSAPPPCLAPDPELGVLRCAISHSHAKLLAPMMGVPPPHPTPTPPLPHAYPTPTPPHPTPERSRSRAQPPMGP